MGTRECDEACDRRIQSLEAYRTGRKLESSDCVNSFEKLRSSVDGGGKGGYSERFRIDLVQDKMVDPDRVACLPCIQRGESSTGEDDKKI